MLCALNREKPDRLPVTIHQWQRYHLNKYMNGMSDIEANRACGLDASITVFRLDGETNDKWKMSQQIVPDGGDRYKINIGIHTPEGDLSCVYGGNSVTAFVTEHPVKEEEDIYLIKKYMPVPKLDRELVKKKYDELGDDGIIRSFV